MGRVLRKGVDKNTWLERKNREDKNKTNWFSIPEVRLIDESGQMVGIVPTKVALQKAKEAELELVNISPKSVPPVCKICDYGKYKYEQQKKLKGNDKKVGGKIKEIQFSIGIEKNDLDIKIKKAIEFLEGRNSVQLVMQLKGRDLPRVNIALDIMKKICEELKKYSKFVEEPKLTGRKIISMCR